MDDVYGAASSASPRARRLAAVTVCACLVALTSVAAGTASPARHRPPHHRGNVSSVTPLPYFAPWQTGFERYSTQVVTPFTQNSGTLHVTELDVPEGQYYRLIAWSVEFSTNATVQTRSLFFHVARPDGSQFFSTGFPAVMTAGQTTQVVAGPQVATFANTGNPAFISQSLELPDVLWSPGTQLTIQLTGATNGDAVQATGNSVLVEVYTEDYAPAVAPASVVTPLML